MADIPASCDLVEVIQRAGYPLRKIGAEWHGACPFCGGVDRPGDPSDRFYVNWHEDRQYFHCRQCKQHGDAITWLQSAPGGNMTYDEARRAVGAPETRTSRRAVPPKPTWQPLDPPTSEWQRAADEFVTRCSAALWSPAGAVALQYLRDHRRLSDDMIRLAKLGWHDPGASFAPIEGIGNAARGITIPRQYGGALWSVNIRRPKADIGNDKRKRYRSLPGSRVKALYNGDVLITPSRRRVVHTAIVCGGEFDTLVLQQSAPPGVAAVTLGGEQTSPDFEALAALNGLVVYLALDADEGGEHGANAWLSALPTAIRAYPPGGAKDITESAQRGADLEEWVAELTGDDGAILMRELRRAAADPAGGALFGYAPHWHAGRITMANAVNESTP